MNYRIIIPESDAEWDAYYKIRYEVLRKPWGQPEKSTKDEWENISFHALMLTENNEAIAAGRLQINSTTEGQIRSMAVREDYRNKSLGTKILDYLEEKAREKKLSTIILDSREKAVNFYKKQGYVVTGPSYLLFDVIPHFRMEKKLFY